MSDANWHARILHEFTPGVSPVTLVADPDGLLQDEGILASLRERGFALLRFDDPVAFRYAYESQRRGPVGNGLVVVVPRPAAALDSLPHDVVANARRLEFGLGELFPNLDRTVVSALEPADFEALYEAHAVYATTVLGENASKEFALRHVFGIVPELVHTSAELLVVLLRRHYGGRRVPPALDVHFIRSVADRFQSWPLERIVPEREEFFGFLQEAWPAFLDQTAAGAQGVGEGAHAAHQSLPFDHEDVRVYVDNLFTEGFLRPVDHWQASSLSKDWLRVGLRWGGREEAAARLGRLLAIASEALPAEDAGHEDWFRFAIVWAKAVALSHEPVAKPSAQQQRDMEALRGRMDATFAHWVEARYAGLASLPPNPPAMLHHIPRFLSQQAGSDETAKVALVVVDGLALDQWVVIRQALARQHPGWQFREGAAFAWVPTITSVSRQAVFAGAPPFYFPKSINDTNKEAALWRRFWEDQGVAGAVYARALGDGPFEDVVTLLERPGVRAAGLVVDKVDRIMHGMTLGTAGMHNQVRQWASEGHFATLLGLLFQRGFRVYLTADHGNIEAVGCGRPGEGVVADVRGERARVYPDESLRRGVAERFPDAWQWPVEGLPDGYLPLLAPGRKAFVRQGERTVAHGGACLEELIVPFVEVLP